MSPGKSTERGLSPEQMRAAIATLSSPDRVSSPFGDLRFFDGVPTEDTVDMIYDALDLMRGVEVFLNCVSGASLVALRHGLRSIGVSSPAVIAFTDPSADSRALLLTPNTDTPYGSTFVDLKAWGPTVVESPPASVCFVDDFWCRYVADMGIVGPDQGQGARYLFLPPGYDGEVPDGYFVYRPKTYTIWVVLRALGGVSDVKKSRIYPLAQAAAPPDNQWVNAADTAYNTVHANDFTFFEEVNELVQEEAVEALDAERAGQLAAIGIVHGQPFSPDERRRTLLDQAARVAAGMARALVYAPRDPQATLYGNWRNAFVGGSAEFERNGARLLDARSQFYYFAVGMTPAMIRPPLGTGSVYAYTVHDGNGDILDGGRTYRLHVDPDPPAKNFWAVNVYDTQTRSLLQVPSTIHPALTSATGDLQINAEGSHDLYFGPAAPDGHAANWVQTLPEKSWFALFRLYGPLQPWFDHTWTLNEFEPLD